MITKKYFKLSIEKEFNNEIKKQQHNFRLEVNDNTVTEGESFNPTSGWTTYTGFNQGWSEQDPDENELNNKLKEFLTTEAMWIEYTVADNNDGTYTTKVDDYTLKLTIVNVEYYDEEYKLVIPETKEIWTNNPSLHVGDLVSTTDSNFEYDEGTHTFDNSQKPYYYKLEVVQHHHYDNKEEGYTCHYKEIIKILGKGALQSIDGEEVYVQEVSDWEQIQEIPENINEYHLDVSDTSSKKGYITDNKDEIHNLIGEGDAIMDIIYNSMWRDSYRYGRGGKWMKLSSEDELSGYYYPHEVQRKLDEYLAVDEVLVVRVCKNGEETLYVSDDTFGVEGAKEI